MRPLFFGSACDRCDGKQASDPLRSTAGFRGFVVLSPLNQLPSEEYVFATKMDAERWRDLNAWFEYNIREVEGENVFHWEPSRGTVRGVILARGKFEIYPDRKYAPGRNRCGLM